MILRPLHSQGVGKISTSWLLVLINSHLYFILSFSMSPLGLFMRTTLPLMFLYIFFILLLLLCICQNYSPGKHKIIILLTADSLTNLRHKQLKPFKPKIKRKHFIFFLLFSYFLLYVECPTFQSGVLSNYNFKTFPLTLIHLWNRQNSLCSQTSILYITSPLLA